MPKRPAPVPRHLAIHHQAITPATRFRRLPVWVSKADIGAYFKLSPTYAQALFESATRGCLIDGVERISKYQLQIPPYPDLIRVMQRHPFAPVDSTGVSCHDRKNSCGRPATPNTERSKKSL